MGSGCGSVGRAVASNVRGPRFISSHRRNLNWTLFTVNWIEKTKIKKKEVGNGPFLKKHFLYSLDSVAPWQSSGTPLHRRRTSHPWHPVLGWISGLQRQLQKILCKSCLGYFCKKIWPKKFRKLTKSHRLLSLALVTQQEHKFSGANTINKFQHSITTLLWSKALWLVETRRPITVLYFSIGRVVGLLKICLWLLVDINVCLLVGQFYLFLLVMWHH